MNYELLYLISLFQYFMFQKIVQSDSKLMNLAPTPILCVPQGIMEAKKLAAK